MITKKYTLVLLALISISQIFAQSIITYSHPTAGEGFATSFTDAVTNAPAGSTIYLPGGNLTTDNVEITKELTIIGAGSHPDSTGATGSTYLIGNLEFAQGSDNSFLTGVFLSGILYIGVNADETVSDIRITRCRINNRVQINYSGSSNIVSNIIFEENIIGNSLNNDVVNGGSNGNTTSVSFSKCVINGFIESVHNYSFKNCIMLGWYSTVLSFGVNYSTFDNNVFIAATGSVFSSGSGNNILNNNLYVGTPSLNYGTYSNNMSGVAIDALFENFSSGAFSYDNNFHLKTSCVGVNAGTDGTDVGIYGTNVPYKEGVLPLNPHIYYQKIDAVTKPDGSLHIEIGVRVQDR